MLFAEDSGDVHHGVERALGKLRAQTVNFVDKAVHEPSADVVFCDHGADIFVAAGKGGCSGILGDGVCIGGSMALEGTHGGYDVLGTCCIADAPSGHGVGFGYAVDNDGLVLDFFIEGGHAVVLFLIVDQLFIDFVGDDVEAVLHGQICDGAHLVVAENASVGVAGGIKDEGLGPVGYMLSQHICRDDEAVFFLARYENRAAPGHADHFRVAQPAGGGNENLVAGIQKGA